MPVFPELEVWIRDLRGKAIEYLTVIRERYADIIEKSLEWLAFEDNPRRSDVAAVDSSFVGVETRMFYIFAVQALAVASRGRSFSRIARAGIIDYASLMKIVRGRFIQRVSPKNMLSFYAQMLELEAMNEVLKENPVELALFDGSITTFLMYRGRGIDEAPVYRVGDDVLTPLGIWSRKAEILRELAQRTTITFVAKTSYAGFYTGGALPDMGMLETMRLLGISKFSQKGFSEPRILTRDQLIELLKIPEELTDLLSVDALTLTYVRFVDGGPLYQVAIVGRRGEKDLKRIVSALAAWSPGGYPLPLESVHRLSKLNKKEVRKLLIHYGVPIVSGREVLE